MTGSINISLKKHRLLLPVNLFAIAYILIAIFTFRNYLLPGSVNFILGFLALPFAWRSDAAKKGSYRYGWMTFVWLVLCFIMHVKTLLYFSIGFALIFFTESFYGRSSLLALLVVLFA